MANDYYSPTMVANEALAAIGLAKMRIGDIEEGTEAATACLLKYVSCFEQLIRGAHWDFARREAPMNLVADASGQTTGVGTLVPGGFLYSYSYPTDCAKLRFIPAFSEVSPPVPPGNIVPPDSGAPLVTGLTIPNWVGRPQMPSKFLLASDVNNIPPGAGNDLPGISPIGMTVVCSNIQRARCVYTLKATYPNLWDAQFRAAMVAYLASEICLELYKDKRVGIALQRQKIGEAQAKIQQARVTNGNETWANADISVDWMRARITGYNPGYGLNGWGSVGGMGGQFFGGWDQCSFSGNSSAF